ncbi:hypothetical protein GLYMA_16G184600v4 [Glycine max]|uniref:Bifunctional inhibitor/plant lipid transfer protein/seed storage helical domain-containing protein n=1 Tax=Glycine max TaxID=3847 RepID=A0A0R0FSK2_SOYBN|nr:hypothetical protein GLYMA_16G184600v4 [Glycine max]
MDSNVCLPHLLVLAITLVLVSHAMGDSAQDKQRCAESLTDCCSGLTQAMKTNKKCVCLILKDRDDPDLGLKTNMTIAVGLPSLCKTPDNLSQCSEGTDETASAKNSESYIGKRFLESLVAVAGLLIWLS